MDSTEKYISLVITPLENEVNRLKAELEKKENFLQKKNLEKKINKLEEKLFNCYLKLEDYIDDKQFK